MIIVSIIGPSMGEALRQISASRVYADLLELRLDLIRNAGIAELIAAARKPVVATCRPVWEGGAFAGSERDRIEMLEAASLLGASYVDIEMRAGKRVVGGFLERSKEAGVIVSAHGDVAGRADVGRLYRRLHATGADVIKLAFPSKDSAELGLVTRFLALARADRQRAVCIAMGEAGEASRVLYRKFGGWATYAAPEEGGAAAPGQVTGRTLRQLYRANILNARTAVFGVIGHPLAQSKGIHVHNPLLQAAGKNAVYCRFDVTDLRRFMTDVAPLLGGFSVTIPHKQAILRHLHRLDPGSKAIGAVNTVVCSRGRFSGTNTDAAGALDAVERVVRVKGKRILLLGAGGAARAIAYEASRRGAAVVVANRTASRARALAREFCMEHIPMSGIADVAFDILINATPVGMVPDVRVSPVTEPILSGKVVFDAVYNPPLTRLLKDAERAGATIIPGTEMYLHQAARQSALYTGMRPSLRVTRKLLASSFHQ